MELFAPNYCYESPWQRGVNAAILNAQFPDHKRERVHVKVGNHLFIYCISATVSGPTQSDRLWFFAAHLSKRDKKKTCSNLLRYQKYQTIPLRTSQQESANGSWNSSIFKSQVWETLITCHSTVPHPPPKKIKKLLIEMANLIEMWLRRYINLDVLNLTSAESLCTQAVFFYFVLKLPSVSWSADLWKEQLYFGFWCRATGSWL